jgi:phytoene dehydrogenase-like protein
MERYDAIIIGAGHNGLVTASYLAKAGKKVVVLERRPEVGGIAATEETFPGFKFATGAHSAAGFAPAVIRDLALASHGLELLAVDYPLFVALGDNAGLFLSPVPSKAAEAIRRFSQKDAERYATFCALIRKLADFLGTLYDVSLPEHNRRNLADLLKAGWRFHRLGEKQMREFLRILPMSIADLLNEWFQTEPLKAAVAASGILGSFVGPRQQGTAFLFLHHQLGATLGALRPAGFVRGGIGNLSAALARAARYYGAEIRTNEKVARVTVKNGVASGVALRSGDEITAALVISSADAKTTFEKLLDPSSLDPHFFHQIKNIRARGTVAKINCALDRLPAFVGVRSEHELGGIVHIGPSVDYLERASDDAKYGRFSSAPFLEITIPSVADPSLAPAGKHVMSIWMQFAPYMLRQGSWPEEREKLGDTVVDLVEQYAPGFKSSIMYRQVLTPLDLEHRFGVSGGHLFHAEMALDQVFFMRPVPGWANYRTPVENLYLCGAATHPGGGVTGLPGYYAAREILRRTRQAKR